MRGFDNDDEQAPTVAHVNSYCNTASDGCCTADCITRDCTISAVCCCGGDAVRFRQWLSYSGTGCLWHRPELLHHAADACPVTSEPVKPSRGRFLLVGLLLEQSPVISPPSHHGRYGHFTKMVHRTAQFHHDRNGCEEP